jgi:hypothetical protein
MFKHNIRTKGDKILTFPSGKPKLLSSATHISTRVRQRLELDTASKYRTASFIQGGRSSHSRNGMPMDVSALLAKEASSICISGESPSCSGGIAMGASTGSCMVAASVLAARSNVCAPAGLVSVLTAMDGVAATGDACVPTGLRGVLAGVDGVAATGKVAAIDKASAPAELVWVSVAAHGTVAADRACSLWVSEAAHGTAAADRACSL